MKARQNRPAPTLGTEQANFLDSARAVAIDVIVEALADAHRIKRLRDDDAEQAAENDGGDPTPRLSVETGPTTGDVLFDFARLQLDIVERVLRFQRKHREVLFERLRLSPSRRHHSGTTPDALLLEGDVGKDTTGTIVVENRGSKPAQVSVDLSELRTRTGGTPVFADVLFSPTSPFVLPADSEVRVTVTVTIGPSFEPGLRYRGHLQVVIAGGDKRSIPLRIQITGAGAAKPGTAQ
jgi:hypothetical protein